MGGRGSAGGASASAAKYAAPTSDVSAMPSLTGSEKQISWANDIRRKMLDAADKIYEENTDKYERTLATTQRFYSDRIESIFNNPNSELSVTYKTAQQAALLRNTIYKNAASQQSAKYWIDGRNKLPSYNDMKQSLEDKLRKLGLRKF